MEFTGRWEFGVSISIEPEVIEFEAGENTQQRGLAASARPHDHEKFAMSDVEGHAVHGGELSKPLVKVADADGRGQRLGGFDLGKRTRHG